MRWAALFLLGAGCATAPVSPTGERRDTFDPGDLEATAQAVLLGKDGQEIGRAGIEQTPHGLLITVNIDDLPPGQRAFHIHETGSCVPPDFGSAGGHFNPEGRHHGMRHPEGKHAGDLPNLFIPESGRLSIQVFANGVSLTGTNAVLDENGSALVIHEGVDDHESQPTGDAGGRVACGVIRQASN